MDRDRPSLLQLTDPSRADRVLAGAWVFLVALASRVLFVIYDGGLGYQPKADSIDFHLIALSLKDGNGYSRLSWDFSWQPTAYRMPLTPVTLSFIYRIVGVRPFTVRLLLALLGASACVLVYSACARAIGPKLGYRVGFLAGLACAVDPFLVTNQTLLLLEPLHVLLVCASVWSVAGYAATRKVYYLLVVASSSALLAINRPDGFAYGVLAAVAVGIARYDYVRPTPTAWSASQSANIGAPSIPHRSAQLRQRSPVEDSRRKPPRGSLRFPTILPKNEAIAVLAPPLGILVAVTLALIPWTVRNFRAMGTFVPLSTASGDLLLGANNQATYSFGPFHGYWAYGALITGESASYGFAGEVRADRERRRLAFEYMRKHPASAIAVVPFRVARGWELYDPVGNARFGEAWGRPVYMSLGALVLYYPALAIALVGAWHNRGRWRRLAFLYLLPMYLTMLFAATTGEPRYRAGIQPVVWIFAALGAERLLERAREKRSDRDGPAVASPPTTDAAGVGD